MKLKLIIFLHILIWDALVIEGLTPFINGGIPAQVCEKMHLN